MILDDPADDFLVLTNDKGEHSLWSAKLDVPAGWTTAFGPQAREACIDFIETHWTALNPAKA